MIKVKFTKEIPICPYCKVPTKRGDEGTDIMNYYPLLYDKKGSRIKLDANIRTFYFRCYECGKVYAIKWKEDGFYYFLNSKYPMK